MTATTAGTVQCEAAQSAIESTAEMIAAYRTRVTDTQLDAMVLGATLAIWAEHSDEGVMPYDVEDALRLTIRAL